MMIDICVPYEDFEYNVVGHYRGYFIIAEHIFMIYLTVLYFRMRANKTPTEMYISNLLIIAWPLLPIRLIKAAFTAYFPLEASQSNFLCLLIRIETTLQYTFTLAHLLMLNYFSREVRVHRSVSFEATSRMRKTLHCFNLYSLITSILFVNLQISSGIVKVFSCIYALSFVVCLPIYLISHFVALIKSTCKRFLRVIQTFLIPAIFPQFASDYLITFRYVTGVLAVRFMVSIIFASGPLILLPPIRRQIFRPILKRKQDRVAAAPELRSAEQIQVSFVN
ncbi:hypothetical protein GCK72_013142 [Caenorhabditis remanei]|uniref:Uncharacterized protein n=1 Tax=Caenorhabditis remanei TaxID=31234 RepID=A0A6A5GMT0_CAERE|nr:hypothetical protein GCK72_013142 [Caenorhabditis remanei]KAF1756688.1 hypothetical protein GCK72_013142 [Caenorhabditis remanei]